ncbi:hypothetical protein RHD99_13285 [Buttiauxella selenatireducens]|uniref:Uncharacterized protein n=1 Tax=Buttiauxella selenatireducens TaxID=3073902 RepID=A0ABY9S5R9_9ENTR|nr:hypothetical protein [Buttiauxella sp. R73]WMY72461.1 hypothetical protein RHD99_13285 [Buttiauxella sp. R73]
MSQKTLSDILHRQARNAIGWLSQKIPGTEHYTPKDLALDVLITMIKHAPKKACKPYDDTQLNGYYFDGPEGPGTYIDGYRIDNHGD